MKEQSPERTASGSAPIKALGSSEMTRAFSRLPFAMVLTNPHLDDNPIVYANRAFETMTGYAAASIIGRNCRFLQNGDDDQEDLEKLRAALDAGEDVAVELRNYRADGSEFTNSLFVTPLTNEHDELVYFMGLQSEVGGGHGNADAILDMLSEMQHRVKNHLSMVIGMIRMQARGKDWAAVQDFDSLARRIETLQLLYEEMSSRDDGRRANSGDRIALGAYISRVANAIAHLDGRSGVRINIDADSVSVSLDQATQIGLLVSEIMTNALQHAFGDRDEGLVEVRVKRLSGDILRVSIFDDGVGMADGVDWPQKASLGGRIARQLIDSLEAKLSVDRAVSGTRITFDVPLGHRDF